MNKIIRANKNLSIDVEILKMIEMYTNVKGICISRLFEYLIINEINKNEKNNYDYKHITPEFISSMIKK